ncbi:hypothetical protein C8R47DRAFT_1210026 [Mycena vitilis]|nr:hypothetical protein C8R47DRAFT_1230831 [Mycena vitilis]KAJ6504777.1 hypothetical protein C8R47DRAFT_1210026 [Mycena vitilis]
MGRPRKNLPPGRKSDFKGEKMEWLDTWRDDILEAEGDPGPIYTKATTRFLTRYGYDLPFATNVEGDPEDNPPEVDPLPDDEEKKRRAGIYKSLRAKLSNYFRNRWKGKKVHTGTIKGILATMQTMSGPRSRPIRKPTLAVYSKLHYATRVKPGFDELWATAKLTVPKAQRVSMCRDFVRATFAKESDEFKEEVEQRGLEMHAEALAEWKATRKIPEGSAESYHEGMETLKEVGIPMADALADRLGAHVVILVVGPVGSEGGEVCLRTVFSDTSNLQTSRTWAQHDHKGFTAMETSITRYGRLAFSKAECRARAWPPLEQVPPPPPPLQLDGLLHIGASLEDAPNAPVPGTIPPAGTSPVPRGVGAAGVPASASVTNPASVTGPAADTDAGRARAAVVAAAAAGGAVAAAAAGGGAATGAGGSEDAVALDDGIDRTGWADCLVDAHAYLVKKAWGEDWSALVAALVQFEWSHYHTEEVGKLPKGRNRPPEYADWFKEHRHLKDQTVSADFGVELFAWWKELGPKTRWDNVGEGEGQDREPQEREPSGKKKFWSGDWCRLNCRGRNGPMLVILGLAWWGQAICNAAAGDGLGAGEAALTANATWQLMVRDVRVVLANVLTQGRAAMDAVSDAEETAEEGAKETEGKSAGGGGKQGKKAKGKATEAKKPAAKKTAAKKKTAVGKVNGEPVAARGTKRKRSEDDEGDERPAKAPQPKPTVPRPRPRPLTKGKSKRAGDDPATESTSAKSHLPDPSASTSSAPAAEPNDEGEPMAVDASSSGNNGAGTLTGDATAATSSSVPPACETPRATSSTTPRASSPADGQDPQAPPKAVQKNGVQTDEQVRAPFVRGAIPAAKTGVAGHLNVNENDIPRLLAEIAALKKKATEKKGDAQDIDGDPFADLEGLTAEELAEMVEDWDADEDEDEDAAEGGNGEDGEVEET